VRFVLSLISWVALAVVTLPPFLYLFETLELRVVKALMLGGTVVWFMTTPFWMGRKGGNSD